jgi:predicted anti-sigma-YlaC factor YlaD
MANSREKEMMTCEQFQSLLPAVLESGKKVFGHSHLQECQLCRSLVVDLERIAEESRELKLNKRDEDDEDGTDSLRSR